MISSRVLPLAVSTSPPGSGSAVTYRLIFALVKASGFVRQAASLSWSPPSVGSEVADKLAACRGLRHRLDQKSPTSWQLVGHRLDPKCRPAPQRRQIGLTSYSAFGDGGIGRRAMAETRVTPAIQDSIDQM